MENHPSSTTPAKTSYKGCFIAIAIVVALAVAGITVAYSLFVAKRSTVMGEAQAIQRTAAREAEMQMTKMQRPDMRTHGEHEVMIQASEANSYSPDDFGDSLTAEHFVAVAASEGMTSLAENRFAEKANGQKVEWLLKVSDITVNDDPEGNIRAQFSLPYQFYSNNGSSGSSYQIRVEFPSDAINQLVPLRKGDWVKIGGNLKFSSGSNILFFENAEVVEEDKPSPE